MKNTDGIIRIVISSLICSSIVMINLLKIAAYGGTDLPIESKTEKIKAENAGTETVLKTKAEKESESAVTAASEEVIKGKIINKFSSPYTANTSYNNVYLKNRTETPIDIKSLLEENLSYKIEKNGEPQVLIVHTHATESFMLNDRDYYTNEDLSRRNDTEKNTVALGKIVTDRLNAAGINTLHSETLHDYPDYNYSYANSKKTIREYLTKYPSIKVVLDMHRDAVGNPDKTKLTTKINGKTAAQVMLVMSNGFEGCRENLKLAVRLQQTLEVMYPSLARSISLVGNEYNQSLTKGSMLIEMGTDANTLEEVKYSAELVSNALISLLNTES